MKLLSANIYAGNRHRQRARDTIKREDPLVVFTQETPRGFQVAGFDAFQGPRRKYGDRNAVLLRHGDYDYNRSGFHQITPRIGPRPGYDAPRWVGLVDYTHDGRPMTAMTGHAPVPNHRRAVTANRVYIEQMIDMALAKQKAGRAVVLGADLNGVSLPTRLLREAGFQVVRNGVDFIAALDVNLEDGPPRTIGRDATGSDHLWLVTTGQPSPTRKERA